MNLNKINNQIKQQIIDEYKFKETFKSENHK